MGGGALGACEQESEGSVPGEVRHSLGGAKLTLSPSPSAASKEPRLRHAAASAAARPQLHHTRAHTHTLTLGMRLCMCAPACARVGNSRALKCFLFLSRWETHRNAISSAQADDRVEAMWDSGGNGRRKCIRKRACASAHRPVMTCELKFGFSSRAHTRCNPGDK